MKSSTERNADLRERKRKEGYVLKHLWVKPDAWERLKAYVRKINKGK